MPPGTSGRDEIIEQRWRLLQILRQIETGQEAAVDLTLDLSHYTSRSTSGQIQLRYCNAFSDGIFHVVRP